MKPAEPQATDIGAVNPVAETSPAEQPAAHPETDVRLLDLNKIVNSTYNPRKNFREDTLLEWKIQCKLPPKTKAILPPCAKIILPP